MHGMQYNAMKRTACLEKVNSNGVNIERMEADRVI